MEPDLTLWQKRALSEHTGKTILDFYSGRPPLWCDVGTKTRTELYSLVMDRLRKEDCGDVADVLEGARDFAIRKIHQRFKSLREKKRRAYQRRENRKAAVRPE
ncbi:MAG: hypothetical protein Q9196_006339 [Gyalolechia fulgens]